MGSEVRGRPESPRTQPAHWLLAVLKCFDPSPRACGKTSPTFRYCSHRLTRLRCCNTSIFIVVVLVVVVLAVCLGTR